MQLSHILGLVGAAAAATHEIEVGNGGLLYSPNVTTAAEGDTVVFHFFGGKHDVAQGSYRNPCDPSKDGFYSGLISPEGGSKEADKIFTIKINNTDPIWFYCSESAHCQKGMVAVINPPSTGNTLDSYASASSKTSKSSTPPTVQGGVISTSPESKSTSTSTSSSTSVSSFPPAVTSTGGAAVISGEGTVVSVISAGFAMAIWWAGLV